MHACNGGAVSKMKERGIAVWMCTGDNRRTAHIVARQLGIDHVKVIQLVLCSFESSAAARLLVLSFVIHLLLSSRQSAAARLFVVHVGDRSRLSFASFSRLARFCRQSEVLPGGKLDLVRALKQQGHVVAMMGCDFHPLA